MTKLFADLEQWLRTHGGCVDESDPEAIYDLAATFIRPRLIAAFNEGASLGSDVGGAAFERNPYDGAA